MTLPPSPLWDITFTVGQTEYGFMLVTPEGESKQLDWQEVGLPEPNRINTAASASYQDFPADKDVPFAMASFIGGLGQLEYESGDDTSYWWGSSVVTHVDGKVYLAPAAGELSLADATGAINGFRSYADSSGNRYDFCWSGPRLYRRDATSSSDAWAEVYEGSATISDFIVFNGIGVVAAPSQSGSTDFVTLTSITGTPSSTSRNHAGMSDSLGKPLYFQAVRGALFAAMNPNKIMFTVDPTADAWAGPIQTEVGSVDSPETGDTTYNFTNLSGANDYLIAFKEDAGFNVDAQQNVTEIFWQWRDRPGNKNFEHVAAGDSLLFYNVGAEVFAYDPTTGANLSLKLGKLSGVSVESVLGLGADNRYVYILAQVRVPTLRSASSVALLRGVRITGTRWSLECLWEDTSPSGKTYYRLAAAPNGEATRLYWGLTEDSATSTMTMAIPANWDESTGSDVASSGVLYASVQHTGFPGLEKRHLYLGLETEKAEDEGPKVAVAYSIDNGATFTSLGDTDDEVDGMTHLEFDNVHSRAIVLRFTLTPDSNVSPVVRVFDHHQRVRFRYLPSVNAVVRMGKNIAMRNGAIVSDKDAASYHADLRTIRTTDEKITYKDFAGNDFACSLDTIAVRPTRHYQPDDDYELEALCVISRADAGE